MQKALRRFICIEALSLSCIEVSISEYAPSETKLQTTFVCISKWKSGIPPVVSSFVTELIAWPWFLDTQNLSASAHQVHPSVPHPKQSRASKASVLGAAGSKQDSECNTFCCKGILPEKSVCFCKIEIRTLSFP